MIHEQPLQGLVSLRMQSYSCGGKLLWPDGKPWVALMIVSSYLSLNMAGRTVEQDAEMIRLRILGDPNLMRELQAVSYHPSTSSLCKYTNLPFFAFRTCSFPLRTEDPT